MLKVNANDLKRLIQEVQFLKDIVMSHKPYPDSEGELTDWAKNELAKARKDNNYISHEELKKELGL